MSYNESSYPEYEYSSPKKPKLNSGLTVILSPKETSNLKGYSTSTPPTQLRYIEETGGGDTKFQEEGLISTPLTVPNQSVHLTWGVFEPGGSGYSLEFKLPETEYTLGRSSGCSFSFPKYQFLSSNHCTIKLVNTFITDVEEIQVSITDHDSLNGTYVNKEKVTPREPRILKDGDCVHLSLNDYISDKTAEELYFTFRLPHKDALRERYNLQDTIGKGHFSTVKRATCTKSGRVVAIKIIEKKSTTNKDLRNYCEREINIMKLVSHPFVNGIEDLLESARQVCIVTELAADGDLFSFFEGHALSERKFRWIFYQILSAIRYLHANNIVHRDLKPENILVFNKEKLTIKVADFGLSRYHNQQDQLQSIVGSPSYVAPEVTNPNNQTGYTNSCDMWSIGIMMYFSIARRMPFKSNRYLTLQETACLSDDGFKHYSNVFNVIKRLLVYNPEGRYSAEKTLSLSFFSNHLDSLIGLIREENQFQPKLNCFPPVPKFILSDIPQFKLATKMAKHTSF